MHRMFWKGTGLLGLMFALGCGESMAGSSQAGDADAPAPTEFQLTQEQEDASHQRAVDWFDAQPAVVAPWVTMISPSVLGQAKVEPGRLLFATVPKELEEVVPGDILIAANPQSGPVFLRRVVSVSGAGGGLQVATVNAGVDEVVLKGELTQAPTAPMPSKFADATQVMPQPLKFDGYESGVSSWFDRLQDFNKNRTSNWKFNLEFVAQGPYIRAKDNVPQVEAKFNKRWFGNPQVTLTTATGQALRTSCDEVTRALDWIGEAAENSEARLCRSAYASWVRAGAQVVTQGMVTHHLIRKVSGSRGEDRLQCTSDGFLWNDYYSMPYPEEVNWAKTNCGGVLKKADLTVEFGADAGFGDLGIKGTASFGGPATPKSYIKLREEVTELSKSWVLWAGWLPVVFQVNGKVLPMNLNANATGQVSAGVKNLNFSVGSRYNLKYDGGDLAAQSSWKKTVTPLDGVTGEPYIEGELSGTLELSVTTLDVDVLIYGVAGPYVEPFTVYARADAGARASSGSGVSDVCPLGMSMGIKTSFGIRGTIPFTALEAQWQLWNHDTCGADSRVSKSFYEQRVNGCQRKCLINDPTTGPLKVKIEWPQQVDVDLDIDLPEGEGANLNYTRPQYKTLSLQNDNGCLTNSCPIRSSYDESFEWTNEVPAVPGGYVVRAFNRGDQAAEVKVVVVGQGVQRTQTVTVPANTKKTSTELTRFVVAP